MNISSSMKTMKTFNRKILVEKMRSRRSMERMLLNSRAMEFKLMVIRIMTGKVLWDKVDTLDRGKMDILVSKDITASKDIAASKVIAASKDIMAGKDIMDNMVSNSMVDLVRVTLVFTRQTYPL